MQGTASVAGYCWVFDPVDGTTNYAHGLPIFCSAASARDRRPARGRGDLRSEPARAVHRRARRGRVAERRADARLVGDVVDRCAAVHRFPYNVQQDPDELVALVRRVSQTRARRAAPGLGGDRSVLRRGGPVRRLLGAEAAAVGRRRRRADRGGSRRTVTNRRRRTASTRGAGKRSRRTAGSTPRWSRRSRPSRRAGVHETGRSDLYVRQPPRGIGPIASATVRPGWHFSCSRHRRLLPSAPADYPATPWCRAKVDCAHS